MLHRTPRSADECDFFLKIKGKNNDFTHFSGECCAFLTHFSGEYLGRFTHFSRERRLFTNYTGGVAAMSLCFFLFTDTINACPQCPQCP